jgi:glycerol-3-phosphate responsive antiterminator
MNKKQAYSLIKKNKKLEEVINHFGDYVIIQRDAKMPIKDICDWIKQKQKK